MPSWYDKPWRHLYGSRRWLGLREDQLRREPLCRMCMEDGDISVASVADHVKRHEGDLTLFWTGELQSLCKLHHDSSKARQEIRGYVGGCDEDGNPKDQGHHWLVADKATSARITVLIRPIGLFPSVIPLTIVCGPAGGGKSTYITKHLAPGDTVIDMDMIRIELGIRPDQWDSRTLERSLTRRNAMLADLATATSGSAWFIVSAALHQERLWWRNVLKPDRVLIVLAKAETCIHRINTTRTGDRAKRAAQATTKWWRDYTRGQGETEIRTD